MFTPFSPFHGDVALPRKLIWGVAMWLFSLMVGRVYFSTLLFKLSHWLALVRRISRNGMVYFCGWGLSSCSSAIALRWSSLARPLLHVEWGMGRRSRLNLLLRLPSWTQPRARPRHSTPSPPADTWARINICEYTPLSFWGSLFFRVSVQTSGILMKCMTVVQPTLECISGIIVK